MSKLQIKEDFELFDGDNVFTKNHWMKRPTLGSRLRMLREEKGLSRPEVERMGGPASFNIYRWERNDHLPSLETLFILAKIYEVEVADMVDGLEFSDK